MKKIKPAFRNSVMTLYRGDALKIIPQLKHIDHCFGDPPYEERMHKAKGGTRKLRTDGGKALRGLDFSSIEGLREPLIPMVKKICDGWFLMFCTPEGIAPWRDAIEAGGMRYKRACFWEKPDSAPQFNGQGPAYGVEPFVTAWCAKGVSRWNGGGKRNLWTANTNNPDREGSEPTEKPINLMMQLIKDFTKPGDVILDPFMGTGTTIIAALACGRKAIGIEKDARRFKLALARIRSSFTMGREEARRHITRTMGRVDQNAGPLFAALGGQE